MQTAILIFQIIILAVLILQSIKRTKKQNKIMEDLSQLQAAVANSTTVQESAITLMQGLSAEIAALPVGDQAAIDALAAKIKDGADALAAAVVANTPAAPAV